MLFSNKPQYSKQMHVAPLTFIYLYSKQMHVDHFNLYDGCTFNSRDYFSRDDNNLSTVL